MLGQETAVLLLLCVGLLLLMAAATNGAGFSLDGIKGRTVGDGQHGTARFAGKGEIRRTFHRVRFRPRAWRRGKHLPKVQGLEVISREAKSRGIRQKVLLRLTPGIDPHTYEAVATGKVDSKFGVAIETGQAEDFVRLALSLPNIRLMGYHCHVGSQVFDEDGSVYHDAAQIMLRFAADMKQRLGADLQMLDLGGGYGVRYTDADPAVDIPANIESLAEAIRSICCELGLPVPAVLLEPGRSIVADAGMTLYTAGSTKSIPGYKNYVSVDGGMTDNPRYALYGSKYTVFLANRAGEEANFRCDVVGRCCESGDIIQPDVLLPEPKRGDLIAVCTTGAYNYSMASNYNRIPRPPVVMLKGGKPTLAVRRETVDDLTALDM